MRALAMILSLIGAAALAQPISPVYFWELSPEFADLSVQPSDADLVNGFPEASEQGVLYDQVLNESLHSLFDFGIIDEQNEIYSWLMNSGGFGCLEVIEFLESEGFLPWSPGCPGCPGNVGQFVDGQWGAYQDGVLRDYARVALAVRFGFSTPTDIGVLRVLGGNSDKNGRTFHHYDVWASTDGLGDGGTFFPLAMGVRTGDFGLINNGLWAGAMTEVQDFDSKYLVQGATDLRLVFYCVDNTQGMFIDPWQGNAAEDEQYQGWCPEVEDEDTDGRRKAFVGPIIREVDVFPPGELTPWGDIDYDDDQDLADAAALQLCFAAPTTAGGCFRFDLDESGVTDIVDVGLFAGLMTGPN